MTPSSLSYYPRNELPAGARITEVTFAVVKSAANPGDGSISLTA